MEDPAQGRLITALPWARREGGRLGPFANRLIGSGAHPIRQQQQIMLTYPERQRVRQLPQLDGTIAQLLAEACL
ncbi:MAG TPA: hypothetical protein VFI55_05485 [Mycobacterium sp.]|nr:hypothetical protein [Mycobacterium sp.]